MDAPVERVEVAAYTVPTDAPEGDGTFAWDSTTMVLVRVAGGGRLGIGWTYGPAAAQRVVEDMLAPVVRGVDALDVPRAHSAMVAAVRNAGRQGIAGLALSAVDSALWDLKARLLDLPLCRLLGAVHTEVPVYGSGGFTTYDEERTRAQLAGWVHEQGIQRVKIKIGESWGTCADRDVARMRLARSVIGEDAELFVDANGGYGRKQAIRVARQAADLDVRWYEEPVSSDDLAGLREVRDAVLPDVTAGEYAWDLAYAERMCAADAVDCLQLDATRIGGPTETLRAAAVAAAHNLDVSAHCAPTVHAHVMAAVPNLRHLEWFHDHVRVEEELFDGTLDPTGGTVRPDQGRSGNGVELRVDIAERYRVS
ncbi:enolase C-terminal domain-like protein [soil metagenome]|jgi:L-alanine-DL-glutamate epimerase-like enolase superfamily enzyme